MQNFNVQLVDHMGDDLTVVNAARVSMNKESPQMSAKDKGLIRYLAQHGHWTPFSHVMVQVRIAMPLFVARQWFKHTVGFSRNEMSRRYVSDSPTFWRAEAWRGTADNVKQGSGEDLSSPMQDAAFKYYDMALEECEKAYSALLCLGVCPEQARAVLPMATMTEFVETGSLYAYARLVKLRQEGTAQLEIQEYAGAISEICRQIAPVSWEALMGDVWGDDPANVAAVVAEAAA
jgi:thymidylate synthase (FAD)